MADLIPTFALIAALVFLAVALFSRNRLAQSQAVLADVSSRVEALSKQNKQLEQQNRNAQENADKYRQQSAQADKQLEDAKQKLYVNRGFGFIGYPGRVGILAEITVIELV